MGRDFRLACEAEHEAKLREAAAYVDGRMRELRDSGKVVGVERIAMMVALDLAHTHLTGSGPTSLNTPAATGRRLQAIVDLIDAALAASPSSPAAAVQLQIL
ncbi:MAG: cell division protein ZapA [Rhodocyclaceae bacterium]|nr:cell division protein ZapA [Rhodocyclaceae bacterium]